MTDSEDEVDNGDEVQILVVTGVTDSGDEVQLLVVTGVTDSGDEVQLLVAVVTNTYQ